MNFTHEIKSNALIVKVTGDLIGEENGVQMAEIVRDAINSQIVLCIIDISSVRFINSSGIGLLITILTMCRNKGGEVYLVKPSENVKKLLIITKLNSIFQVVESEEDAIAFAKR